MILTETDRQKALTLINALFDGKRVEMKDPSAGVNNWVIAVDNPNFWSYLGEFVSNLDKYRVVENVPDVQSGTTTL